MATNSPNLISLPSARPESGAVYPAAGYAALAGAFGAHTVELNLAPTLADVAFDEVRAGPASVVVPRWVEGLLA